MDDLYLQLLIINRRRPRLQLPRQDPFHTLSDKMFIKMFRLSKDLTRILINILNPFVLPATRRSALSREVKILVALHFYATGSYQNDIGYNIFCGVSQSSVSRCVNEITAALNLPEVFNAWVKFYENIDELNTARRKFYEKYGVPGVIGVIDCGHIAIFPPPRDDENYPEHIYVNRKNYHSVNVQFVCDSDMKFINVNSRFPGSANDLYVWSHSTLEETLRRLSTTHPGFYLIGDSGYYLRKWLHIPVPDALPGTPEHNYNNAFKSCRSLIERSIGLLKIRFRCLLKHRVLHYNPTKASHITNACVVLHNMCIANNIPIPDDQRNENIEFEVFNQIDQNINVQRGNVRNAELDAGRRMQRQIIQNYFQGV